MSQRPESGVTLIEMTVVVLLISLVVGIAFPALTSGIDSLRLSMGSAWLFLIAAAAMPPASDWTKRSRQTMGASRVHRAK